MAATEKQNIWAYASVGNVTPQTVIRKMKATQGIYMAGCPFYINTDGTLTRATTSDGTNDAFHCFARAGVTAQLAANTEIRVDLIRADILYAVYVENNDSDAAATQDLIGAAYGLRVSATAGKIGYVTVDVNNSNDTVKIVDIMPNIEGSMQTIATSPGIAIVQFLQGVIDQELA